MGLDKFLDFPDDTKESNNNDKDNRKNGRDHEVLG